MRSILEKALVHLLNEEHEQAEALFHQYMVERARQIHESLRQGDDSVLDENWEDNISEDYFTEDDLTDDDADVDAAADELGDDLGTDDMGEDDFGGDDFADAEDDFADAEGDLADAESDLADADADLDGDADLDAEGDTEARISDLEDQLEQLTAEFEEMMANMDGDADMDADADMDGDLDGDADMDADADLDADDFGGEDDFGDDDLGEFGDEGDDMADSMEDDMDDTDDAMKESVDEDDFEDITESVLAELEKVSVSMDDGKEVAAGKGITTNKTSPIPQKPVGSRQGGKPVAVKAETKTGFERETAPDVKPMKKRKNTAASSKEYQETAKKPADRY